MTRLWRPRFLSLTAFAAILVAGVLMWPVFAGAQESSAEPAGDPRVEAIQEGLRALGYEVRVVDGLYGPNTRRAIEAFEKKRNLAVTGEASRRVLERVDQALFRQSQEARRLWDQARLYLRALGYAPGRGPFDSPQARVALDAFASAYWIESGRIFDRTLYRLIQGQANRDPAAQSYLCRHHMNGGAYSLALKWCRARARAAEQSAQYFMGWMAYYGRGRERDREEAFSWFHAAAQGGHQKSRIYVGLMYRRGDGVARDPEAAMRWYEKANADSERGHSR